MACPPAGRCRALRSPRRSEASPTARWLLDELPLEHPGVGNLEVLVVDLLVAEGEHVEIHDARSPANVGGLTSEHLLDLLAPAEERAGAQRGLNSGNQVDERTLRRPAHRLGLVEAGGGRDPYLGGVLEGAHGPATEARAFSDVRANTDVGRRHALT